MYHIKPIISSDVHIELPTSMYKIKPISTDHLNDIHSNNLNVGGYSADVSEKSSKKTNQDIVQQINNILKVYFDFQSIFVHWLECDWYVILTRRKWSFVLFQQSKSGDMEELEARQAIILKQLKELKERLTSMHKELNIGSISAQSRPMQQAPSSQTKVAHKPIDVNIDAHCRVTILYLHSHALFFRLQTSVTLWSTPIHPMFHLVWSFWRSCGRIDSQSIFNFTRTRPFPVCPNRR